MEGSNVAVDDYSQQSADYGRIEKAIRFIEENFKNQPSLDKIAESVHLSKFYFDRIFKRWVGINREIFPKKKARSR